MRREIIIWSSDEWICLWINVQKQPEHWRTCKLICFKNVKMLLVSVRSATTVNMQISQNVVLLFFLALVHVGPFVSWCIFKCFCGTNSPQSVLLPRPVKAGHTFPPPRDKTTPMVLLSVASRFRNWQEQWWWWWWELVFVWRGGWMWGDAASWRCSGSMQNVWRSWKRICT